MRKYINYKPLVIAMLLLSSFVASAADWTRMVDMRGAWQFSIGDDYAWAKPEFNDANWDKMPVPGNWDNYYPNYNGYGWYRKTFDVKWMPQEGQIGLLLGYIDDVDEVFINGVRIGQTGQFNPNLMTAYLSERIYFVPQGILKKTNNVIAIRVYDIADPGGIVRGNKIGLYYDDDYSLLSQDLSGNWKFSLYRNSKMYNYNFDDSQWSDIVVPGNWEAQGFQGYDGNAYYRLKFNVSNELLSEERLYLVLGKIDDMDKVYLNGEQIARTEYIDEYSRHRRDYAWKLYRVYRIPTSVLKEQNILVVEVRDDQGNGGIYEGPIGIMTPRNASIIRERNDVDIWDNPIEYFLDKIFD